MDAVFAREGGGIRLFITLVPKVLFLKLDDFWIGWFIELSVHKRGNFM